MNTEIEDWIPVALLPESFETVEARLADGTVRLASWVGNRWWTPKGTIVPVEWRPRREAGMDAEAGR